MSDWVAFLSMNEVREENGIANKENWRIVSNQIPIAVLCVELDSETTGITSRICRTTFSSNSRKSDSDRCFLSDLREDRCLAVFGNIVSYLKVSKCT